MIVVRALDLTDQEELSSKLDLKGVGGSLICEGSCGRKEGRVGTFGSRETTRSYRVGFGGGAKNAMAKSVSCDGEDGVTMMAGRSAFSSTRGRVRSRDV